MKKTIIILLLGAFVISASAFALWTKNQVSAEESDDFVKGEVLVKFKDSASPNEVVKAHKKLGGRVKGTIPEINVQVVDIGSKGVGEAVSAYARDGKVEYAEPNFIATALTDDTHFEKQWGLNNTGQITCNTKGDICTNGTPDADVDAPEAWNISTGSSEVKIAILDTGIDQDHPDLDNKLAGNINFTSSGTVDDLYGHGTHVAGIAAAETNNTQGIAGIGHQSKLINVKVLNDNGSGRYDWIAKGIIWATKSGAKVINLSLGGNRKSSALEDAVNFAWDNGAVVVAAAGNSDNPSKTYPAYYENVIAVAATDNNDVKASFSSYGNWVDVAAPGEKIYSTFPNHDFYLQTEYGRSKDYDFGSGTSMSAPFVSGLAALLWSTPAYGIDNYTVRSRIETTADAVSGTGSYWAWGRINACNAVGGNCSYLMSPSPTPEPTLEPSPKPTLTPNPYCSLYCFKGVCDGQCHPVKDGALCPDCQ